MNSVGYGCPIFHNIGNAKGGMAMKLGVLGVFAYMEKHH